VLILQKLEIPPSLNMYLVISRGITALDSFELLWPLSL